MPDEPIWPPQSGGASVISPSGDTTGATDTAAINAAITAANAKGPQGGGQVILGPGVFWTTGLTMKSFVSLVGSGWGTRIKGVASIAVPLISPTDGSMSAVEIANMVLDGNKQGGGTSDCINLSPNSNADVISSLTSAPTYDPRPRIRNVFAMWAGRDGISLQNGGLAQNDGSVVECYGLGCGRYGLNIGDFDCRVLGGSYGINTQHCVVISNTNCILTGVKAWYAGTNRSRIDGVGDVTGAGPASFDGFNISGNSTQMTGCQSQDNGRFGVNLNGCRGCKISGHVAGGENWGLVNFTNAHDNDVDVFYMTSDRGGLNASGACIWIDGATTIANRIRFHSNGAAIQSAAPVYNTLNSGSLAQNAFTSDYWVADAVQSVTWTATVTPNVTKGRTHVGTVTGACTVGPTAAAGFHPPGTRLTLIFTQDGTGHAITWDASYKNPPTVSTTAAATTVAEFVNTSLTATPSWQYVA